MNSNTLIQSYIPFTDDLGWFVSTVNRQSSVMGEGGRLYAETMVASWEPGSRDIGPLVPANCDAAEGSLDGHMSVCWSLFLHGKLPNGEAAPNDSTEGEAAVAEGDK